MKTFHLTLSCILVIASILPIFNWRLWIIYGLRAQRFQIAVFLAILLIIFPCFHTVKSLFDWLLVIFMFAAFAYNSFVIYPFTIFAKPELLPANHSNATISILSANVRMSNNKYSLLINCIKEYNPDVVFLAEVDKKWVDGIAELEKTYTYNCLQPQDNTYGLALYSKLPLKDLKIEYLIQEDIPSVHCTIVVNQEQNIRYIGLHPKPPAPWTKEENKDFELLAAAVCTKQTKLPTIVTGDMNDVAWSPVTKDFKIISGLVDPRVGRGFYSTYNVYAPFFRMPIDHCFVSRDFKLVSIKRLPKIGSDHFPIFIQLSLDAPK